MTTTNDQKVLATARRRRAVRLTMIAGSMLTLAASWFGVVRADQLAEVARVPDQPAAVTSLSGDVGVTSTDTTSLVPAPPATRQVIVVRRTRAS